MHLLFAAAEVTRRTILNRHDFRLLTSALFILFLSGFLFAFRSVNGQTNGPPEIAFDRIIHGWTNYSTAFNATHDTGASAEYASVAALFTPNADVIPVEYGAIVIGGGTKPPGFPQFQFRVLAWSSLDAFIQEPRLGDVATWNAAAPSGGSTSVPDATTRGGRPAYEVRFNLTNSPVVLSNGHTYLIGFAARADSQTAGELFVPTSSYEGPSDVQAGDLVVGGWRYLVNAGGSTVYSGQLAVELTVAPLIRLPSIEIAPAANFVRLAWPASASDFVLEYSLRLGPDAAWYPVEAEPFEEDGKWQVILPASFGQQWFRLRR